MDTIRPIHDVGFEPVVQDEIEVGFLFLARSALRTTAALETTSLGALKVVAWDPLFVVRFNASAGCRAVVLRVLCAGVDLLGGSSCTTASGLLLLWKVWRNPNGVEEVADACGAGEEEDVEEDAGRGQIRDRDSVGAVYI